MVKEKFSEMMTYLQSYSSFLEVLNQELASKIYFLLRIHESLTLRSISELLGKSKSTISRHVQYMVESKVLIEDKKGKTYYYSIAKDLKVLVNPYQKFPEIEKDYDKLEMSTRELILELAGENLKTVFTIFGNIVSQSMKYIDLNTNIMKKQEIKNYDEWIAKTGMNTEFLMLDEEGKDQLLSQWKNAGNMKSIGKVNYIAWSTFLPISEILSL